MFDGYDFTICDTITSIEKKTRIQKKIETWIVFILLSLFTLIAIYPILNIISISLHMDNAFQTKSLAFFDENSDLETYFHKTENFCA